MNKLVEELEAILAGLEKLQEKHSKAESLRVRNALSRLKNGITDYKRELMSMDKA